MQNTLSTVALLHPFLKKNISSSDGVLALILPVLLSGIINNPVLLPGFILLIGILLLISLLLIG